MQRGIKYSEDIVPISDLKVNPGRIINQIDKTHRPVLVTSRGRGVAIVESLKDYEAKDISVSQINQLNKYLEDCNCNLGFLICYKKPKKDSFLIGENKIFVLDESEINKVSEFMDA